MNSNFVRNAGMIAVLIAMLAGSGLHADAAGVSPVVNTLATINGNITVPKDVVAVKRELRAAWVATVYNIDWPSKSTLTTDQQKAEMIKLLDDAAAIGLNAVIVQVRGAGDSLYPSQYGPWSKFLTGQQGKAPNPYYDPLAFMVEEAHKRNLEFHAWFNPFRAALSTDVNLLAANHPARLHPDWLVKYNNLLYFNPGIPETRKYVMDGVLEVVKKYDIDAVHFDDYFYPYQVKGQVFDDSKEYSRYGTGFASIEDWRRNNVNTFVKELAASIKKEKAYVKFGISPYGVWRNKAVDPTGSDTSASQTNYDHLFADTRKWITEGWIDYVMPQIYWYFGQKGVPYEKVLDFWQKEVDRNPKVHLYIGHASYQIGSSEEPWKNADEVPNQLKYNQLFPNVKGSAFYNMSSLRRNPLNFTTRLKTQHYKTPALVPAMPWLDSTPPQSVLALASKSTAQGMKLVFMDRANNDASYYVIYRFDGRYIGTIQNSSYIIGKVRKNPGLLQSFDDKTAVAGKTYTYVITAVDRTHNESKISNPIIVKK